MGRTHWRYTRRVNFRQGARGWLWQGRFASCPMERRHALAAVRYVETNPVRARLAERPEGYRWSSARFHLRGEPDGLTEPGPLEEEVRDWAGFFAGRDGRGGAGAAEEHVDVEAVGEPRVRRGAREESGASARAA